MLVVASVKHWAPLNRGALFTYTAEKAMPLAAKSEMSAMGRMDLYMGPNT